jgi:hypothetical protein
VLDLAFPSGWKRWDAASLAYVDSRTFNPNFNPPRPLRIGVPVYTVVGGYDPGVNNAQPSAATSLLYTPLRGNYGNTFEFAAPNFSGSNKICWLEISFANGSRRQVNLAASRESVNRINRVSYNVAQSENPTTAKVACRTIANQAANELTLSEVVFPTDRAAQSAPTVIGEGIGYDALRIIELAMLGPKLEARSQEARPVLAPEELEAIKTWRSDLSGLSAAARAVADRALTEIEAMTKLRRWINFNRISLDAANAATIDALRVRLRAAGFAPAQGSLFPTGALLSIENNTCFGLTSDALNDNPDVEEIGTSANTCPLNSRTGWWVDARGALHPAGRPDLCLRTSAAFNGAAITLANCDAEDLTQSWRQVAQPTAGIVRFDVVHRPSKTLDAYGNAFVWDINNSYKQRWRALAIERNPLLSYAFGSELKDLKRWGM